MLGLGLFLNNTTLANGTGGMTGGFTPASLFTSSQVGAWYDPSDLSTVYQDSVGLTPAAVGQPVGLILDKRLGATLGPELVPGAAGSMDSETGWTIVTSSWTFSGGKATANVDGADMRYDTAGGFAVGDLVEVRTKVDTIPAGILEVQVSGNSLTGITVPGTYTQRIIITTAFTGNIRLLAYGGGAGIVVDSISVKKIPGNHAWTDTTAAKPILRQDGAYYYLEHDGVDDRLMTVVGTVTFGTIWTRISALRQTTWTNTEYLLGGNNGNTALVSSGVSPNIALYDGVIGPTNSGLAVGVNGVVTEKHTAAADAALAVNNGAYVVGNAGGGGVANASGVSIGGPGHDPSGHSNIRFYGLVVRDGTMSDADITSTRAYLASKSGVTL